MQTEQPSFKLSFLPEVTAEITPWLSPPRMGSDISASPSFRAASAALSGLLNRGLSVGPNGPRGLPDCARCWFRGAGCGGGGCQIAPSSAAQIPDASPGDTQLPFFPPALFLKLPGKYPEREVCVCVLVCLDVCVSVCLWKLCVFACVLVCTFTAYVYPFRP